MVAVVTMVICLSSSLCLYLLFAFIKVLHKLCWTPYRIQYQMLSQGIRGPSYRFINGSSNEISSMKKEARSRPMNLSHDIFSKVQPHIHSWVNKYGKNYLQWHGSKAELVITEPELIKEILNNKDRAYRKEEVEGYLKKLLGDGLVTTHGEKWAKMRKLADYAFHADRLKIMVPEMIGSVEVMLERWKLHDEGKEIEVYEEFNLLTSEIISRTAFGSSYLDGKHIFQMLMKMELLAFRNADKIRFPGMSKIYRTVDEIESEKLGNGLRDCILEIIKKREEKVRAGEVANFGADFLGVLIKAHHDDNANRRISIEDLVDECKTFYIVGQETANGLLAWTVFLLAIHTEWQEEARKEVLKIFGHQNPNPDGITKLKTMNMIINESLRLYPPIVRIKRRVDRQVRLGLNLTLPANLGLCIPNIAVHHNPQMWGEDVHLFKPERFSDGVAKATNNNAAAYIPFGMGPRNCVGLNFATTQTKIALSMILQRYAFTLSPAYVHSPVPHPTLRPQHGIQIVLHSS
ncbi:hypothetical protein F2P56_036009 [Juglans regia]|uniref:Cytochrome P450 CYP749A22-like n=2 Tax=Juglans regia TaxID=51240 RepID=A0A833X6S4_JUGRE|nr:cytochrome P450 CYP749A22-like [Juglans regia]KAF5443455.1 hypothetical protein F2P56_036009 [Juglans regia]